ncbi:MAG: hypothetical protein J6P57_03120 [Lachnospiraceae bacterium]|nr:hypothetical protein [Lachnospiraceae bacterium]
MRKGRCVSYIYRYRDNERCENTGFIKIQCVSNGNENQARIQIGLKLYKRIECRCEVYLLHGNTGRFLTDINFCARERDTIMKRMFVPWDNPLGDYVPLDEYSGLFFLCDDGEQLLGIWDDKCVSPEDIIISRVERLDKKEEKSPLTEHKDNDNDGIEKSAIDVEKDDVVNKSDVVDKVEEIPTIKMREEYNDACEEMLNTYPKLALFADSQITECVKIKPQDIGKLHMNNWKLGENSFLSHGFYQYRYIMLGKVKLNNEKETVVIGVPGVFSNKERYLANMFGFGRFIPVKKDRLMTGKFGYWISEVSRA